MQKIYNRTYWENLPSTNSEIDADNLNNIEAGIDALDNRTINLDTTKATKTEVSTLISEIEWNEDTGVITFTRKNGSKFTIDTKLEKLAVNFGYDQETEKLVITLSDGTIQYVDLSALITVYEFLDSETIAFQLENGKVKAVIKEGSVEEKHLQPNYLADIRVETAASSANATAAANSAVASESSASAAKTSESNAASSATAAKTSETNAKTSETNASTYAINANASSVTATEKATESADYAGSAKASANTANTHANTASSKASEASTSANRASIQADAASDAALLAESYAVGGTGTRENEDVDNARYYKEQAERISQGLSGALLPMGTITFSQLSSQTKQAGYMYNISDSFVTDSTFKEGPGHEYAAGTNVYYTADGYWDAIAGTNVTGVKGSEESSYRQGNVNITKANIGLGNVDNTSDANKPISTKQQAALDLKLDNTGDSANNITTFTSGDSANPTGWADIVTVGSGETHASLFRKISLAIKNLRYLYKMLGSTDISKIGNGTVTGGLSTLNANLANAITVADNGEHRANIANALFAEGGGGLTCKWGADEDGVWKLFIYIGGTLVGKLPIMTLESSIADINSSLGNIKSYKVITVAGDAEITDMNNVPNLYMGMVYGSNNGVSNVPYETGYGYFYTHGLSDKYYSQTIVKDLRLFTRVCNGGVWGEWDEKATNSDLKVTDRSSEITVNSSIGTINCFAYQYGKVVKVDIAMDVTSVLADGTVIATLPSDLTNITHHAYGYLLDDAYNNCGRIAVPQNTAVLKVYYSRGIKVGNQMRANLIYFIA